MSKKEKKIYKITDCRKNYGRATLGYMATYLTWMVTLFTPNNFDQFITLAAAMSCRLISCKFEAEMFNSVEIRKMQEIYRSILKKYIEINHTFDFKKPLDVFTLFNFAVRNNFFSITNKREMILSKQFDTMLVRELSLNGHGVCRHISAMLTDVYKELGIQSEIGICLTPKIIQVVKPFDEEDKEILKSITEEMQKITQLKINGQPITFDDMIKNPPMKIVDEQVPPTKKELKNGNHAITLATDDLYTYYLDALNSNVFTGTDAINELISEQGTKIKMMPTSGKIVNSKYEIKTCELKEPAPMDFMLQELRIAETKIMKNEDILESFQKDIKDELEEAEELHRLILK